MYDSDRSPMPNLMLKIPRLTEKHRQDIAIAMRRYTPSPCLTEYDDYRKAAAAVHKLMFLSLDVVIAALSHPETNRLYPTVRDTLRHLQELHSRCPNPS